MTDLPQSPLQQMREALMSGKTTALKLVHEALGRISQFDRRGPGLNAVLEINPQAEAIAICMDAEIRSGRIRGPLHGVPVVLKDNIDTADMMHTSAGSLALKTRYAPRDAFIAGKLREAGAVILGKANMTEFANYIAEDMPNGYSSRGGQVINPWGAHDPGGSSTGSAVAVAAGYTPIAIGTETLGSIISPASENGVVGVKPTVGLVSRSGILPISISQDTAGPMGLSLMDCALALDVICGADVCDPYTLHGRETVCYADVVAHAPLSLGGLTLGLYSRDDDGHPATNAAFLSALDALEQLGASVVDVKLPAFPHEQTGTVMCNEFRACMDAALRDSKGCPQTLSEIASYNQAHAQDCLKYGQAMFERALEPDAGTVNPDYIAARAHIREHLTLELSELFARHSLSAVITPNVSSFAIAGFPSICLPTGQEAGRPVALVLNGLAFSEPALFTIAAALERKIGLGRRWTC